MPYYSLSDLIVMNLWEYCRNHYCSDDLISALEVFSRDLWYRLVSGDEDKTFLRYVMEKCSYNPEEYDEEALEEQLKCIAEILEEIMAKLEAHKLKQRLDTSIREILKEVTKHGK